MNFAIFLALGLIVQARDINGSTGSDEESAIGAIAEGYAHNRNAFRNIDCRFSFIRGTAESVNAAVRGEFLTRSDAREAHWLVSGPRARYEMLCGEAEKRRTQEQVQSAKPRVGTPKETEIPVECAEEFFLQDKNGPSLGYWPLNETANLFRSGDPKPSGIRITPFSMNLMGENERSGPDRYLSDHVAGRNAARFVGVERILGQEVVLVECGERVRVRFGFDPARGYMLASISLKKRDEQERLAEAFVTQAREFPDCGWFPMRTVVINNPDGPGPYATEEIRVTELDVDREPNPQEFSLTLPRGTQVNVIGAPEWVVMKQDETVNADELAELHQRAIENGKWSTEAAQTTPEPGGPEAPQPRTVAGKLNTILIVHAIGFALVGGLLLLRRIRRALGKTTP